MDGPRFLHEGCIRYRRSGPPCFNMNLSMMNLSMNLSISMTYGQHVLTSMKPDGNHSKS